jgi:hypothetical protein
VRARAVPLSTGGADFFTRALNWSTAGLPILARALLFLVRPENIPTLDALFLCAWRKSLRGRTILLLGWTDFLLSPSNFLLRRSNACAGGEMFCSAREEFCTLRPQHSPAGEIFSRLRKISPPAIWRPAFSRRGAHRLRREPLGRAGPVGCMAKGLEPSGAGAARHSPHPTSTSRTPDRAGRL